MYRVIYISSGIVAASFGSRSNALQWVANNGFDDEGNDLHLYKIVKD